MSGSIFIGTSGWNYKHWANGRFYPKGLAQKNWLSFYASKFGTVELNNTFYRLPSAETFADWARTVPREFIFATKASRFITHIKRLKEPEESVRRFLSRLSRFGKLRGPILFQLPPQMKANPERLEDLHRSLKRSKGLRVALEFRHESWLTDEVYNLVEKAGWTICLADAPKFKCEIPALGSFCYIRRHGATARYASCYSDEQLSADAKFIASIAKKRKDVYVYFNNCRGLCARERLNSHENGSGQISCPISQGGGLTISVRPSEGYRFLNVRDYFGQCCFAMSRMMRAWTSLQAIV